VSKPWTKQVAIEREEDKMAEAAESRTRGSSTRYPESARGVPKGLELGLRNYWYPVFESGVLAPDKPYAFKILGEYLVAWRDRSGHPHVVRDKCPHRAAKLSAGNVLAGDLQCAWHGLRFNGEGRCTLIPWEPNDSPLLDEVQIKSYPAGELADYVWVYIGEAERFSIPRLEECVPEEFLAPETFVVFRHEIETWNCNWLQTLDGVDSYHAAILHHASQSGANDPKEGSKATPVSLEERRMKIIETPQGYRGVALDREGNPVNHGHFLSGWKGERFTLPGLHSLLLRGAPGSAPFGSRHYQIPVDETHTLSVRFVAMRGETAKQRAEAQRLWEQVVRPRQRQVSDEDKMIIETLGDLYESRSEEYLFKPDQDIIKIRRRLADAYTAQVNGMRELPTREALSCPA
jgi:phenylpropionate dioxygenase-like ring-hydroxylating dioxygenase large terminal subunit